MIRSVWWRFWELPANRALVTDGKPGAVVAHDCGGRAVLPQGKTWAASDRTGANAADLLPLAVVWSIGRGAGRRAL